MVQEVQTSVGLEAETTLETIQAIGTSSVKIKDGRQTTGRYVGGCTATCTGSRYYRNGQTERDSGEIQSTDLSITSTHGKAPYIISEYGIRVPSVGTYEINLHWMGGGTYRTSTIIIKSGGKVLYTNTLSSGSETVTFYADLGKFSTIEVRCEFYYGGSESSAACSIGTPTLIIKQL